MKRHVEAELEAVRRAFQGYRAGNIELFLQEQERRNERSKMLERYRPYPKQLEFHNAGKTHREVMLMAPNQSGKTTAASAEVAYHLTGLYPDWWDGRRFDRPVAGLAASETGKRTRDGLQVHLCGAPKYDLGSGMIPGFSIPLPALPSNKPSTSLRSGIKAEGNPSYTSVLTTRAQTACRP
jgi:hypothetical protein